MADMLDIMSNGVHIVDVDSFANQTEDFALEPNQIVSVKIDQSIDPVSLSLPISTAIITVRDVTSPETVFAKGRKLCIIQDGYIVAIMFVDNVEQINGDEWRVALHDYIGTLADSDVELTTNGWGLASGKWPNRFLSGRALGISGNFVMDEKYEGDEYELEGFLPYASKRDGVRNIAFAIGAAVLPNLSGVSTRTLIKICPLSNDVTVIPTDHVLSIKKNEAQTNIKTLKCHLSDYSDGQFASKARVLYDAEASGPSSRVIIKHDRPFDSDSGNDEVEVIKTGPGYVVFSANSSGIIGGFDYVDNGTDLYVGDLSEDDEPESTDVLREVSLPIHTKDENLARSILTACYNYLTQGTTYRVKLATKRVKNGSRYFHEYNVALGDVLQIDTEDYGTIVGRVIRMQYNLTGGIIVKDVELKKIE